MAIPSWPNSLPDEPLLQGYREVHPDLTLRSKLDKGPAKVSRKGSKGPQVISVQFSMSSSVLELWEEFVEDTLAAGSLRFTHTHPRTGASIEMRLVGGGESGMFTVEPHGIDNWIVSCDLEVLP